MQEGTADIAATKPLMAFTFLAAVSLTPSAHGLPDLSVSRSSICGRLTWGEPVLKKTARRLSLVSADDSAGTAISETTTADEHLHYCFSVPPGRYRVAPIVTAEHMARGLVVAPPYADIELRGEPVHGVEFRQAILALLGSVACLDGPCPGDVFIQVG
jgi:hypothetical protein